MTFYQWLKRQNKRDDLVGDLARDAIQDTHPKGYSRQWWFWYLEKQCHVGQGAMDALQRAWDEYRAEVRQG